MLKAPKMVKGIIKTVVHILKNSSLSRGILC